MTLAHRGEELTRPTGTLRAELQEAVQQGKLRLLLKTQVSAIHESHALLLRDGEERIRLANEWVLIQIGGGGAQQFLSECGVQFGTEGLQRAIEQERQEILSTENKRLQQNIGLALAVSLLVGAWCLFHWDYYDLALHERPLAEEHAWLRPSSPLGLSLGWFGVLCLGLNLSYLLRRWKPLAQSWLTPRRWFSAHVATGLLIIPIVLVHSAVQVADTTGGYAAGTLLLLVFTGSLGRSVYSFLPRAANGRHLAYEEVREELQALTSEMRAMQDPLAGRIQAIAEQLCDSPN